MAEWKNFHARCLGCYLRKEVCLCSIIRPISLETKVSLILHAHERKKTTNSGRWLSRVLTNFEMRVRGARNCRLSIGDLANDESVQPLFLYPSSNAILLCEKTVKQFKKPIHLIVPDGTWSQVRRLIYREQELSKIPYVTICTRPSRYRLRASPTVGALSTYEAVAAALQVIEGAHAYSQLNSLFEEFVTRTLTTRTPARRGTCTVFSEST